MIEHAEHKGVPRQIRVVRPTIAYTLCGRWVDVIRLALPGRPTTCGACAKIQAERGEDECSNCGRGIHFSATDGRWVHDLDDGDRCWAEGDPFREVATPGGV